jgi:WD40 repeat protein
MLIKTFRLFVSSTFADFAAEREVLQAQVFPALDAYCAAKGYQFYPLDLRWGISEEAGRDQRTADICLEEVEAANGYPPPNFLILLGDRYGWAPLPFAIARDEFEAMLEWLARCADRDVAEALLTVYRLDENRLIPAGMKDGGPDVSAYTLRSREDDLPELKAREAWKAIEDKVRAALQKAADGLLQEDRIDPAAREKYVLSLTEREIRGNLDATTQNARGAEALAFIRTVIGPGDSLREREQSSAAAVAALKARVERTLAEERIVRGTATCDAAGSLDLAYLAAFAAGIEAKLKEAIDWHIAKADAIERGPDYTLHSEREEHRAFRAEKLKVFVGRESNLGAIARYIASDAARPLVLHGPSGSGKTALMARAVEAAEKSGETPLVTRFIGASAGSSDLRALLLSVIDDLAAHGLVERPAEYDQDANKFSAQIKALLASISGPAVFFLDALDQLKKPYRVDWLPETLPSGTRLVLSVLDDPAYETDCEIYRLLRRRFPEDAFLAIEPLSTVQGRDILLALEAQAKRELRDSQRDFVIRHFEVAGTSPLYIRTAFEIARGWRSWEADAGRHVLAADTTGLIAQFIAELTSEHHHARKLVARTLGYLTAAKDGLSAKELTEVLGRDVSIMRAISTEEHGHHTTQLPPFVWVRLNRALKPFLIEKRIDDQPLLHFFHRQVAEVARRDHYDPSRLEFHATLATYFEDRATPMDGRWLYDKRSLSELPYQLHHAGDAPHAGRLNDILLSPDWMQQKLFGHGVRSLINDYHFAKTDDELRIGRTLNISANILTRDPRQLVPQLLGRLSADREKVTREKIISELRHRYGRALGSPPFLAPGWSSLTDLDGPEVCRFEEHADSVRAVAFSPDGQRVVSASADGTLCLIEIEGGTTRVMERREEGANAAAYSPDGRQFATGYKDGSLCLWEQESGSARVLGQHGGPINTIAFSPDGRHVASGSDDRTIRIWDANSGTFHSIGGNIGSVRSVAFSPDGSQLLSGVSDERPRLWDLASETSRDLTDMGGANAVAFSADGRHIACGGDDGQLCLWNIAEGTSRHLKGHDGWLICVAFSPDNQHLVSAGYDGIRIWNMTSGASQVLAGHRGSVFAVAFAANHRLVSGAEDRTVRVWDLTRVRNSTPRFHSDLVNGLAISASGRHLVSGSSDGTVRLWDLLNGESRVMEDTGSGINAVTISPNGQYIVAGSDDGTMHAWDLEKESYLAVRLHAAAIFATAFSTDNRRAAVGTYDGSVFEWDIVNGSLRNFGGHRGSITDVKFSPDGRYLACSSGDRMVHLFDVETGVSCSLDGHTEAVWKLAFSPDGRHLASCSLDKKVHLRTMARGASNALEYFWEAKRDAPQALAEHNNPVFSVAFSPDGTRLVSGAMNGTPLVWEVSNGTCRAMEGHRRPVYTAAPDSIGSSCAIRAVAWPSNTTVVAGSDDCTLRLWEIEGGQELARLDIDFGVRVLAATSDGKTVAVGDGGGRVHLIEIVIDETSKSAWLGRCGGPVLPQAADSGKDWEIVGNRSALCLPATPPNDIGSAPPTMQVRISDLRGARILETYRGRHLFALADGRVYIDGLIAVGSLDHARATLDHMAQHTMDS